MALCREDDNIFIAVFYYIVANVRYKKKLIVGKDRVIICENILHLCRDKNTVMQFNGLSDYS